MKRYSFVDASYASMVVEPNGEYVLASEAQAEIDRLTAECEYRREEYASAIKSAGKMRDDLQAEIERLRELVRLAWEEGCHLDGAYDIGRDWLRSCARKSLTPPAPTPNP